MPGRSGNRSGNNSPVYNSDGTPYNPEEDRYGDGPSTAAPANKKAKVVINDEKEDKEKQKSLAGVLKNNGYLFYYLFCY